jgi:peptidoglycan/LPS O-acetylase OafA/YrhL
MSADVAARVSPAVFFQNLFFLQVMFGPPYGSNAVLWSLAYEFWFYILFPLGLFTLARKSQLRTRAVCAFLLIVLTWFCRPYLPLLPVWLAGSLLTQMPTRRLPLWTRLIATVLYAIFFFFSASNILQSVYMDYILGVATFFFIWMLLGITSEAQDSLQVRFSRKLADFSYSLYVLHAPFLLFLTALILGEHRWRPTSVNLLKGSAIIALVIAYAYAVASSTEMRTDAIRRWIEQHLPILRPASLPPSA